MKLHTYDVVVRLEVASLEVRPNLAPALASVLQQMVTPWARANDCLISNVAVTATEQDQVVPA